MLPFISLGDIQIPTYFFLISIAFCIGVVYFLKRAQHAELSPSIALDMSLALMLGSFIGSRLFHIIYEEPGYYLEEPMAVFWVWQGGFVFYGGLIGALLLSFVVLKFRKQKVLVWLDALSLVFFPVYIIGRLATLFSGSGYGQPTDLAWGIVYPPGTEAPSGIALHPTPIYSMLWCALIWLGLSILSRKKNQPPWLSHPGQLFWLTCIGYSLGRFIIEQFRNDARGDFLLSLSVSSWISFLLLTFAAIFFAKGIRHAN